MSKIFVIDHTSGSRYEIDFPTLVSLIKGTSITSLADADDFTEFGLSARMNIRFGIGKDNHSLQISLFSTLNKDDVPPVRLQLINDDEKPTAALVERRLHGLRQVYAITLLLDAGRGDELAAALLKSPDADLEQSLLHGDEHLYLQEAGPGSWWVVALTKLKGAPEKALNGLSLFFGEGRSLLLERVRVGTKIKQQELERQKVGWPP